MITSKTGFNFAMRAIKLLSEAPPVIETTPSPPPEPTKPPKEVVPGPDKVIGSTDYEKWENYAPEGEEAEETPEETAKKWAGGCSGDHRKERELYDRPTLEKLQAARLFKDKGNTAFKEEGYSLAALNYRKGLL
jgi:hypothetical protein